MTIFVGILVGVCLFPSIYIIARFVDERWSK